MGRCLKCFPAIVQPNLRIGTYHVEPTSDPFAPAPAPRPLPRPLRWLLRLGALLCLGLAVVGVIVPGMPTTVFVLMAAWAAARSSPELHAWLLRHRIFGPVLHNWEHGRTVSRRSKWTAAVTMGLCALVLLVTVHVWWAKVLPCLVMATVLAWLWSRPEPSSQENARGPM